MSKKDRAMAETEETQAKPTKRKAVVHFEEGTAPRMVDPTELASGQLLQFCTDDGIPVQGGGVRDPEYVYSAIPVDATPATQLRMRAELTARGYAPVRDGIIMRGLAGAKVFATTRENKEALDLAESTAKRKAEAESLARMKESANRAAEGSGGRIWQAAGEAQPEAFR